MLQRIKYIVIIFVLLTITTTELFAQSIYGPSNPNTYREIYRVGTQALQTSLIPSNSYCLIGKNMVSGQQAVGRLVFQWNIPDNIIPDGSTITNVQFHFEYTKYNHSYEMDAQISSLSIDNSNPTAAQLEQMWYEMSNTAIDAKTGVNNVVNFTSNNSNDPFNIAVRNSLVNDRFVLGLIASLGTNVTDRIWHIQNPTVTLRIEYLPPTQTVTLDQRLSNNTQIGKLRKWEGQYFTQYPFIDPGTQFIFSINSTQTIQGDQAVYPNGTSSEKYNNWNADKTDVKNHHEFPISTQTNILTSKFEGTKSGIKINNILEGTTVEGGIIKFKDPWLIDYPDPNYGNTLRNQGMSAPFRDQNSGFMPDLSSSYNGYVYQGIFTGQLFNSGTYYSVGSPAEQTIFVNGQSRKFYPLGWGGTGVTLQYPGYPETGIVFNNSIAVATATLKGHLMSNSTAGISSNSQRKMVRTDNGIYHLVYESMGSVWYTISETTNFGGEWSAEYLVDENAKNPSLAYHGSDVYIVYEYYDPSYGSNAIIRLFNYWNLTVEDVAYYPTSYFGSAKPVISYNNGQIFIAYRKNSTEGLKEKTKWYYSGQWNWAAENGIPETDANSINPAIIGTNGNIHIAFESLGTIKYKFGYPMGGNGPWRYNALVHLSTGSGYTTNNYPSISLCNSSQTPYVMVSWHGNYIAALEKKLFKENDYSDNINTAVAKVGYGTSWGGFSSFSNNVNFTNNNSLNTSLGSILTWSESNGQYSKYVRRKSNGTYDPIASLSTNGIQTFVSNGSAFDNMKVMVFNSSTPAPYLLNRCNNSFPLNKIGEITSVGISYGRSGVVEKNNIEFLFNIGDVFLDDQIIRFVERIDTLPVNNIQELNSFARTESFPLNSQSELLFSNLYYVVNSELADSCLTDAFSINFKCELINASTNQVVGTFDNVTYNKLNVQKYDNQSYLIDCSGIEADNYYLRLNTTTNEEVNLFISDIQKDEIQLEKSKLQVRSFNGEGIPTTYDLAQNYPNPFNPSTTIRYQIPQHGIVTLKIYDILGAEVTTLVNEQKPAGRYEVSFNASQLSSGIYIYKIQAGDFISSKKMILLK